MKGDERGGSSLHGDRQAIDTPQPDMKSHSRQDEQNKECGHKERPFTRLITRALRLTVSEAPIFNSVLVGGRSMRPRLHDALL